MKARCERFEALHYDLASTLTSGQAFRWTKQDDYWEGIIHGRWVRLQTQPGVILAEAAEDQADWDWLRHYLQLDVDLKTITHAFPKDPPMLAAVASCPGLRLLRQDPWECLASFILSSTKQIVQIRQIVDQLCVRFGDPIPTRSKTAVAYSFPSALRLAGVTEEELRDCKMGFRAPYLLKTARMVSSGLVSLELHSLSVEEARTELLRLPGVGRKIADCVLLFAYGFQQAFPIDVWVLKALRELYFPGKRVTSKRISRFAETHFGPFAGYAQQYLFHYMRVRVREGIPLLETGPNKNSNVRRRGTSKK